MPTLRSPNVVRQQFREIKCRAGAKMISFHVTLEFLPKLRTYLRLRDYVLNGSRATPLFINCAKDGSIERTDTAFLARTYKRLEVLGLQLPRLGARKWRAAKNDWLTSTYGPVVASEDMGHSLATALKSYTNGTQTAHRAEMSAFLGTLESVILEPGDTPQNSRPSAVGMCTEYEKPIPILSNSGVAPDCRSSEGCLFCENYRIHADESDTRKLISCRRCIRETSARAMSLAEYDTTFGAVLRRIDFLLNELRKRDAEMVARVEHDVETDGNLDEFWADKLALLYELGLA